MGTYHAKVNSRNNKVSHMDGFPGIPVEMDDLETQQLGFAWGQLEFEDATNKSAKYMIVRKDYSIKNVVKFMTKQWQLTLPSLIISVTGGAQNFKLKPRLTQVFRKSLIKLAQSTGAWIVTGGTHTGVMKHVGKAVHEYATAHSKSDNKVITLGIAPWGVIYHRSLLSQQAEQSEETILYPTDPDKSKANQSVLDKNHSHFILFDDGSENSIDGKKSSYGHEIEFRAKIEKHIALQTTTSSPSSLDKTKILICCVIVQGGPGSLKTVFNALKEGTPVVVVAGSGQWANILATLLTSEDDNVDRNMIKELLTENSMKWKNENQIEEWTNLAEGCLKLKMLVTVFQLDAPDSVNDLDIAILQSLLKGSAVKVEGSEQSRDDRTKIDASQLRLALAWNRSDIAASEILTDDSNISKQDLFDIFLEAITEDKPEFVQVLLDHGVDLSRLKWDKLEKLYTDTSKDILSSKKITELCDIQSVMRKLLGKTYLGSAYENKTNRQSKVNVDLEYGNGQNQSNAKEPSAKVPNAKHELFQWAILSNRPEIAEILWQRMWQQLPASIAATAMFKALSKQHKQKKQELLEQSEKYKTYTVSLLTCLHNEQPKTTNKLLTWKQDQWGGLTCLQMAVDASSREVVSHTAVQELLTGIWRGGIDLNTSRWRVFAACVFPMLIFLITFNKVDSKDSSEDDKEPGFFKKLSHFFTAPIVKYVYNIISHMVFLLLFAYILLFNFYPYQGSISITAPSIFEWVLFTWVIVFAFDEVYEVYRQKNKTIQHRIKLWFSSHWNKMDLLALCLFIVGYVLRFDVNMDASRILLSFSFTVYCIRILHIFTLSSEMGPKVIMIGNMLKDILFFIFILVVFLFAYGVSSQGLLYPNEWRAWPAISGVVYKPYWQIYGELFLDEINYDPNSGAFDCTSNVTLLDAGYQRCPREQDTVPVLSAIYMLLANVLLLNLLIAMFSFTFSKLTEENDNIWKFQRYELIEEYYRRPWLPTPFSIIYYALSLGIQKKGDDDAFQHSVENKKEIKSFEHWNVESYLAEKREKDKLSVDSRIQVITDRLDSLTGSVDSFSEHLARQKKMSKRVKEVESLLANTNEALRWIMQAMQDHNTAPKQAPDMNVHKKATTSPYPKSNVNRYPVPDYLISWTVPMPKYSPVFYTAQSVLDQPMWADEPLEGAIVVRRPQFNEMDGAVDRRSYLGRYRVINGLPRNPRGRTGITGRGLLGRYGPNHAADPIVTRWEKDGKGHNVEIGGKKVLEFVAIKREDTGEWAIPGGMVDPGEKLTTTLHREFTEEVKAVCSSGSVDEEERNRIMDDFFASSGVEIFKGYCDDHRNTDNSWIETTAVNFHDNTGDVFKDLTFNPGPETTGARWTRIDSSLKLFASHQSYIKSVALKRDAHF